MPGDKRDPPPDLKLPSGPSARRRRSTTDDPWGDIDQAERHRPVLAIVIVAAILFAGLALIISGFST